MTRETKIGLLLGLGVILLIGIILSDQISQRQQGNPADFTEFAGDTQRSIEATDAAPAPGYGQTYTPGRTPYTPSGTPADNSTVNDVPEDFLVPEDVREEMGMQQASADREDTPAVINLPVLASNVDQPLRNQPEDDVPTLVVGDNLPDTPILAQGPTANQTVVHNTPRNMPTFTGVSVIKHRVMPNENLTEISRRYYGNGDYWRAIMMANPDKVGQDGSVRSGVVLNIPKREDAALGMNIESVSRESIQRVNPQAMIANQSKTIEIKPGDTLSELASKYLGSAGRWDELLDANRDQLETATDLRVGMKLKLPADANLPRVSNQSRSNTPTPNRSSKTYTVKAGDNLTKIAEKTLGNGDKWREIFDANRDTLSSADQVKVGQTLRIPG